MLSRNLSYNVLSFSAVSSVLPNWVLLARKPSHSTSSHSRTLWVRVVSWVQSSKSLLSFSLLPLLSNASLLRVAFNLSMALGFSTGLLPRENFLTPSPLSTSGLWETLTRGSSDGLLNVLTNTVVALAPFDWSPDSTKGPTFDWSPDLTTGSSS